MAERVFGENDWTAVAPGGFRKLTILSDLVHVGDFIK